MALVIKDRVVESSTSTGTGAFTLSGAETGYQGFSTVGSGNTCYYTIQNKNSDGSLQGEWEVGLGTYTTGTLTRTTVYESSNGNNLVSFSAGSKDVFIDLPSEKAVYLDDNNITNSVAGVQFDTTATPTIIAGLLGWDGNNTLSIGMAGGNVVQHIGEDQFFYVKASSAITKGQVCMFTGAVGASGVLTAAPATGTNLDGLYIMGIAAETIANNSFGLIQCFGTLRGINTSAYTDGAILWYDPTSTGAYTSTQPAKGYTQVVVAAVASAKNNGTLAIRVTYIPEFGELPGVSITSPTTGQALVYNTGIGLWSNSNAVVMNGGSVDNSPIGATTASTGKFTSVTTPSVTASATDLTLSAISTGAVKFNTANGIGFQVADSGTTSSAYWTAYGTSGGAILRATSASSAALQTASAVPMQFMTNTNLEQMRVSHTASAVNYVQVTGSATGNGGFISAQGSDANIDLAFRTKGTGLLRFDNVNGGSGFKVSAPIGASTQYLQATGSASAFAPILSAQGTDTNISMAFQPKGTGAIDLAAGSSGVNISNGGTVTAITRTATGSGYTSFPTPSVTAPTTAGGVQAVIAVGCMVTNNPTTVQSGGTGYTLNDVLTLVGGTPSGAAATFTVTGVTGGVVTSVTATNFGQYTVLPANPVSVTGGTGTGATLNVTYGIGNNVPFTISNAGSGYIEQPTVSFSGGGGSGAAAYATVGSGTIVKSIGASTISGITNASIVFQTPNTVAPNFLMREVSGADSFLASSPNSGYAQLIASGNANAILKLACNGTGRIEFNTNGFSETNQMRVAHTASAVNYVQVTGAATGNQPAITAQGSDANINMNFQAKGSGALLFNANGAEQFRSGTVGSTVNSLSLSGASATNAPSLGVRGSDTNINLALTPKGTGTVQFGTYTASVLTPTGYITITDSGGTTRRLLVG